jgi:hypothetical protein
MLTLNPGCEMEKFGSGIRAKYPGFATLLGVEGIYSGDSVSEFGHSIEIRILTVILTTLLTLCISAKERDKKYSVKSPQRYKK